MTDARRYDLSAAQTVVCLIDLQERLLAAMPDREAIERNTCLLLEAARLLAVPVLWSEQYPKGLGPTVAGVRSLLPAEGRAEKLDFSAWREPAFAEKLRATGRRTVLLPGIETHVCVMQTALDLLAEGYRVFVPADCVSSRTAANKEIGLSLMREAGAVVTSMETAVFQMFGRAGSEPFKAFSKLIR